MKSTQVRAALLLVSASLAFGCDAVLDAPHATYTHVHFDAYLKSPGVQVGSLFGQYLALDETTLVVSAPLEDAAPATGEKVAEAGAVYVFDLKHRETAPTHLTIPNADVKDGQFPRTRLPPTFINNPVLGVASIALSEDWIAVGFPGEDSALAPGDEITVEQAEADNSAPDAGAVYLYRRSDLSAPPLYVKAPYAEEGDLFGASLAISDRWLAVGAMGERSSAPEDSADDGAPKSGAIFMYRYDEEQDEFAFQQFVKAPRIHEDDIFGSAVSLEGNFMVVGSPLEDGGGAGNAGDPDDTSPESRDAGAIYTYRLSGDWTFEDYLKSPVPDPATSFGWTVQLFGGRIAVGQPLGFSCFGGKQMTLHGVAYVISRDDSGEWTNFQCLDPSGRKPNGLFGAALAGYEDRLAVGAAWEPDPRHSGTVYAFEQDTSGAWQERASIVAPNDDDDDGFGVALGVNSKTIAVGAYGESSAQSGPHADQANNDAHFAGAAYLFSMQ